MPELVTEYRLDQLPFEDIARYRAAFGFAEGHVPVTWWYLIAQRAHLATMLEPDFPFRIAGMVHMENALTEHGRFEPGQALLMRTTLRLLPTSYSGGLRCTLETVGSSNDAVVFTCTSTYLIQRGTRRDAKPKPEAAASPGVFIAQWTLDAAAGRRYARLSGDWNPIHLATWSARLMGMRAPIIHGMHTLAASCAALEKQSARHATSIACRFRAPVALGTTLALQAETESGDFVVDAGGKPAVTGHCRMAESQGQV